MLVSLRKGNQFVRLMSTSSNVRSTAASGSQVYESKRAVHEYLLFHYGKPDEHLPHKAGPRSALNFPGRSAQLCNQHAPGLKRRALDVGCAVGASSFELARFYEEVVGIDFSQHFIDAANLMKTTGNVEFESLVRGNVFKPCTTDLDQSIDRSRVSFQQGDACNLSPSLGKFDVILASNLLCRLPNPRKFLSEVPRFLNPGGSLVLISPYSWLEEYTPMSEWIGGTTDSPDSGAEVETFLKQVDTPLTLVHRQDIDFVIREHERKYQYGVSDVMVWTRDR